MAASVLVIGGGVGGLTAAHELVERGFTVDVYESRLSWGGKARSQPVPDTGTAGRRDRIVGPIGRPADVGRRDRIVRPADRPTWAGVSFGVSRSGPLEIAVLRTECAVPLHFRRTKQRSSGLVSACEPLPSSSWDIGGLIAVLDPDPQWRRGRADD